MMKTLLILLAAAMILPAAGCSGRRTVEYSTLSEVSAESISQEAAAEEAEEPDEQAAAEGVSEESAPTADQQEEFLYVDISGAVENPGVYQLPAGSRMFHAVAAAGGFQAAAETRCINQADLLSDGEKIYIYSIQEAEQLGGWMQLSGTSGTSQQNTSAVGGAAADTDGKVNLNLADRNQLMTLTGVGEARADAIIAYRENNGGFSSIEDIMKVSGIKEKLFEQIRDNITV
ncbi:MAG: helix-hairpin-helix domain-containing protein [Lachnospiraceae bacterium]|nr:helix-hairpin-helix domain-containing protein [Lachnospiraceae bacterium]